MIERKFERALFSSRWLLAPFYACLAGSLILLLSKLLQEFASYATKFWRISDNELILAILSLIDLTLMANLLIIVIFSGYESFVSKIETVRQEDRPNWMGKVNFSGLKQKLIASIVAISAIQVLKAFMNIEKMNRENLAWLVGIHLVFVLSGVLLALMDKLSPSSDHNGQQKNVEATGAEESRKATMRSGA